MKSVVRNNRGSVLWVALVAIMVAMSIALSMLQTSVTNVKSQDQYTSQSNSFFATHGATELVMSDLWGRFNGQNPAASNYTPNFVTFLNNNVTFTQISTGSGDSVAEDFRLGPSSYTLSATLGAVPVLDNPTKVYRAKLTNFNNITMGDRMITGVRLYKKERPKPGQFILDLLVVAETQKYLGTDAGAQASLVTATAEGRKGEMFQPQWENQLFVFTSPPKFNGFDYALLTKNLTCTMCHMRVRSRSLLDNMAAVAADPSTPKNLYGNFDRIKVGITDFLGVRSGSMYSTLDGSLYHRGTLQYEGSHANLTPSQFSSDTTWSVAFNNNATTVQQDPSTGFVTATPFVNMTTDSSGNTIPQPAAGGNLYLNYSTTNAGQTDGVLPTNNFPKGFPEIPSSVTLPTGQVINGPNSKVDAAEVTAQMTDLTSLVNPSNPSSITGGIAVTLAPNTQYSQTNLPPTVGSTVSTSAGSVAAAAANISASYTGNVILVGTQANPIKIDGKVVIDGDVVIRGYVQGAGQIYASGNIYAPGDVIYNNVNVGTINEKFGVNNDPDPKKQTNLLGLVAGKNIVVGDYLSQVTHWDSSKTDFFKPYTYNPTTKVLTANPGSPEPGKKQTYVAGSSSNNNVGPYPMDLNPTFSLPSGSTIAGGGTVQSTYSASNFANFTVEQMAYFNRNELSKVLKKLPTSDPTAATSYAGTAGVTNPNYDPNYIPRFYSMYKYDPANPATNPAQAFLYSGSTWDNTNKHWNGTDDPHVYEFMTPVDSLPVGSLSDAAMFAKNVINVHPDWISPATMMRILSDEADKHVAVVADPQYGTSASNYQVPDRRLDGVLYTNNAIFCIERKQSQYYNPATGTWSKVNAKTGGYMQVNGALIAPDTGILVTGNAANNFTNNSANRQAFVVNYDARTKNFMALGNQDFSSYTLWGASRNGMVRNAQSFMPTAP